jgi:protein-disulfide isomerase
MRFAALVLVCSLALAAGPPAKSAFNKATMEDYIRHLILVNPQVTVTVEDPKPSPIEALKQEDVKISWGPNSEILTFYVSGDGRYLIDIGQTGVPGGGGIYDIDESPFAGILKKLDTTGAASFGAPGAPLSLVMFSDMQCPQCRAEAETVRKNLLASFPTQVRVYFMDFPLSSLHPWASQAAITGRCVLEQGQPHFWSYVDWIYASQNDIKPDNLRGKAEQFAKDDKLDLMRFGHCLDNPARMTAEVDKEIAIGKSLNINETPTIFLNGRRLVGNVDWDNLKAIIQMDLDYAQTHLAASNEKCCEITPPSPLKR